MRSVFTDDVKTGATAHEEAATEPGDRRVDLARLARIDLSVCPKCRRTTYVRLHTPRSPPLASRHHEPVVPRAAENCDPEG